MIEEIDSINAEISAILTMVLDEVQGIYNLKKGSKEYELDRLKNTLMTSLFMMSDRVEDISLIAGSIIKKEAKGSRE